MIAGNTTNLNDYNNLKYPWVSDWYRQAMNNFWIPEEINLSQDLKDYHKLLPQERKAYDKILFFSCVSGFYPDSQSSMCRRVYYGK